MAGEAQIKITSDSSQALGDIKRLDVALGDLGKATSDAAKTFAKITAAAAAVGYAISRAIDSVSDLKDMSTALGVSAQNLKYLQQSAALAGVGADELNAALVRMNNNIGTALLQKTGPAAVALKNLGINMTALKAASPDKQFQMIAKELSQIPDVALRSALAIDLLGKQGPRLIAAAAAMDDIRRRTEELGIALTDLDVEMIDKAGDKMDELKGIITAGVQKAVAGLSPYIITMVNYIESGIKSIRENASAWIAVAKAVAVVVGALITFRAYMVMTAIIQSILAAALAMVRMYEAIKLATTAMEVLNAVMGKNPIVKIVSAVVAIGTMFIATKAAGSAFKKLDADAQKTMDGIKEGMKDSKNATDATGKSIEIQGEALRKANDEYKKKLNLLSSETKYNDELISLGRIQATINKTISDEEAKRAEQHLPKLTAKQRELTASKILENEASKLANSFAKQQLDYETAALGYTIDNKLQRDIAVAQRKLELDYGKNLTPEIKKQLDYQKEQVGFAIQHNQALASQQDIRKSLAELVPGVGGGIRPSVSDADYVKEGNKLIAKYNPLIQAEKEFKKQQYDIAAASVIQQNAILAESYKQENIIIQNGEDNITAELIGAYAQKNALAQQFASLMDQTNRAILDNKRAYENEKMIMEIESANRSVLLAQQTGQKLIAIQEQVRRAQLAASGITNQGIIEGQVAMGKIMDKVAAKNVSTAEGSLQVATLLFGEFGKTSKSAFETYKKLAIAQALIETAKGVSAALAGGFMAGGPLGIFTAPIYAAMALASGMAQVQAIRSMQYTGRAVGGPMVGGKGYLVGEKGPEIFTPSTAGTMTPNDKLQVAFGLAQVAQIRAQTFSGRALGGPMVGGKGYLVGERGAEIFRPSTAGTMTPNSQIGGGAVTVNFSITANDTRGFDELITSRRQLITSIISDAQLESGRRM